MRNFLAVYTKEMRSYFVSPVAYVIAGVFLFLSGYLFRNILMQFNFLCMQFAQQAQYMGGQNLPPLSLNEIVVTQFFGVMDFIWLLVVPMLTMRLFAEEKKNGTMELLMTSPISSLQVLLGKFFACLSLYTIIVALTLVYCLILELYGEPDWGPIFSAYLGYILLGGTFIAVGVLASALTTLLRSLTTVSTLPEAAGERLDPPGQVPCPVECLCPAIFLRFAHRSHGAL